MLMHGPFPFSLNFFFSFKIMEEKGTVQSEAWDNDAHYPLIELGPLSRKEKHPIRKPKHSLVGI